MQLLEMYSTCNALSNIVHINTPRTVACKCLSVTFLSTTLVHHSTCSLIRPSTSLLFSPLLSSPLLFSPLLFLLFSPLFSSPILCSFLLFSFISVPIPIKSKLNCLHHSSEGFKSVQSRWQKLMTRGSLK
jgi:hypothetical protein